MENSGFKLDDSRHSVGKPRGVLVVMPKRHFLSLEEVLFRLENKTLPTKVALVLEWSLAGMAIRRSCAAPVQLRGPSS